MLFLTLAPLSPTRGPCCLATSIGTVPDLAGTSLDRARQGTGGRSIRQDPIGLLLATQAAAVSTGESRSAVSIDAPTCKPLNSASQLADPLPPTQPRLSHGKTMSAVDKRHRHREPVRLSE